MSLPADLRPERHTFVPDEFNAGATCRRCGEAFEFGALHPEPPVTVVEDAEPDWICRSCWHEAHTGACRFSLSRASNQPCRCEARAS